MLNAQYECNLFLPSRWCVCPATGTKQREYSVPHRLHRDTMYHQLRSGLQVHVRSRV